MELKKKKGIGWCSMLAATVTLLVGTAASAALLHNSAAVGTKYGTWGVAGGKYGAFTCATCHNKSTTNIKRVATTFTTPNLSNWSSVKTSSSVPVTFNNVTGTIGVSMGNDAGGHTTSLKVCEVCHSKTAYHRYNTTAQTDLTHANNRDCVSCHAHNKGFVASCNTCHGYPPSVATPGPNGLATPATNATAGAVGAHVKHDNMAMNCNSCHSGFNALHQDQQPAYNNIQLGFDINATNVPSFGSTAVTTGTYTPTTALFGGYSVVSSKAGTTINAETAGRSSCSIYCHNPFTGANGSEMTPDWTSTTAANCGTCHGAATSAVPNPTAVTSGAHPRHASNLATSTALSCDKCHGAVVNNGHVDGKVGFDLNGLTGVGRTYTPNGGSAAISGNTNKIAPSAAYGTCNNIYCHSSIQSGTTGTGAPVYTSATWGGANTGCTMCHVADTTLNTGSHLKHITANTSHAAYACADCHNSTSGNALHANGTINVSMAAGTYNGSTVPQSAFSNCTVTCHGAAATPNWGSGALPVNCSGCHGTKASGLTAPHAAHMNFPATGGTFTCIDCHGSVVSNDTTVSTSGKALHVNTFINFSGNYASPKQQAAAGAITCSTASCHNSGKNSTPRVAVTWTGTIDCSGCHGSAGNVTGMPYPDAASVNAHAKHMNNTTAAGDAARCVQCHDTTVNATNALITGSAHLNKTRDVRFSKVNTFAAYSGTWSAGGRSCTTTYCHGGLNAATPAWGTTTLACNACHESSNALLGAHGIHYNSATVATSYTTAPGTSSTSATAYVFACSACHGADTTQHIDYPKTAASDATLFFGFSTAGRGAAAATAYVRQGSGSTDAKGFKWTAGGNGNCTATYCHSNGRGTNGLSATVSWAMTTRNTSCTTCHGSVATVANGLSGAHNAHMNNATQGGALGCVDCHATTVSNNTTIGTNSYNKHVNKFVDYSGVNAGRNKTCASIYCHSNGSGVNAAIPTWTSGTTLGCNGCHTGDAKGTPATGNHVKHMATAAGSDCFMCHSGTTAAADTISTPANHINRTSVPAAGGTWKSKTVTFTVGGAVGSRTCSTIVCHGTGSVQASWNGAALDCNGCHPLASLSGGANSGHTRHMGALTVSQVKFYNYTANKSPNTVEGGTVMYGIGCVNCHPSAAASHFNGAIDVVLNHTLPAEGTLANKTASGATVNGTVGTGTVTCTATYCHGNGVANINTTPAWNGSFTGDRCANCHLNSPTTNAHAAHTVGIHFDDIFNGRSGKLPSSGITTANAAHGAGNRATTMDCYVCHNTTINVAGNDKNIYCVTCHFVGNTVNAAVTRTAKITNLLGHVNGATEVAFVGAAIRTKAQLRDGSFDGYTSLAEGQWRRNAGRGYKNYTSSYDYTNQTLAARAGWNSGPKTCATVACHGGATPTWNATPLTCDSCHTRL